uniref:Uncharacterized protein n=1 Tax=Anopheles epiroticus TaxID=199890 RepID=A0A182PU83_9DIPT
RQQPVDFLPNCYGDRFIPRRYALSRSSRFKAESKPEGNTDPMKMKETPGYWRTHHYSTLLKGVLGLVSTHDKILSFRDGTSRQVCKRLATKRPLECVIRPTYNNLQKLDWSCKPRSRPIGFIEAVHDLPNIKTHYHNIIDWSFKGQIAAIFSKKLVIWTPNKDVIMGRRAEDATAIAFCPAGNRLAMATFTLNHPWLHIFEMESKPFGKQGSLKLLDPAQHFITCLTWDGSGQYVVCGFDNGQFLIAPNHSSAPDSPYEYYYCAHSTMIIAIRFSCGMRYMASLDDSGELYIWYWSGGQLTALTRWSSSMCAFFDWHPWREDEIVIAHSEPVMIALFHVPTRQSVSYYRREQCDCIVTTLSFNKISGELVVCLSFSDTSKQPEILVLASMDRVVDVMRNHDDSIVHLLWSPNGTQLASVGYDETLTIWNFFGNSPLNESSKKKMRSEPTTISNGSSRNGTIGGGACSNVGKGIPWELDKRNKDTTYRDLASSFLFKAMR